MTAEQWSSGAFLAEATAWVADSCGSAGLTLTGEWEQPHNRAWSSAIRFETDGGRVWFKVNGPGTRQETGLLALLSARANDLVPDVLASDSERGWTLMRDAGPILRTVAPPDALWAHWEATLARYAEGQIELVGHAAELLATGVPEISPATLPSQARDLLEGLGGTAPEQGGLTACEARAVADRLPAYDAWCAALAESGVPVSIQHDDLHSGNICWPGPPTQARIIDWGDASVGHPLGTMLVTLNSIAHAAGCKIGDPRVTRLRDSYLTPFTRFAPLADLVGHVALARRVGCVARALSWQAALDDEPVATHARFEFPVRGWLLEMLAD